MPDELSLQEHYAPHTVCFGCGPSNTRGLHIRSFADGDDVVAEWQPEPHHAAFENVLNGGIIGTLLDCHCNWTAAYHLMRKRAADRPPTTVTADYPHPPAQADADRWPGPTARTRRRVDRRPRHGRRHARVGRHRHGNLSRHVRGGQDGPPGLRALVTCLFQQLHQG